MIRHNAEPGIPDHQPGTRNSGDGNGLSAPRGGANFQKSSVFNDAPPINPAISDAQFFWSSSGCVLSLRLISYPIERMILKALALTSRLRFPGQKRLGFP